MAFGAEASREGALAGQPRFSVAFAPLGGARGAASEVWVDQVTDGLCRVPSMCFYLRNRNSEFCPSRSAVERRLIATSMCFTLINVVA